MLGWLGIDFTDCSNSYALEGAGRASGDDRMLVYIVRHACNHLMVCALWGLMLVVKCLTFNF